MPYNIANQLLFRHQHDELYLLGNEKHIEDTLIAGDNLSNPEIVRITITESTERVKELVDWGTRFDKKLDGSFKLGREGGHSENRVLHRKDQTGKEIERALVAKVKKHKNKRQNQRRKIWRYKRQHRRTQSR